MFKIFTCDEDSVALDINRVEMFKIIFRELRYGEGEKAVLCVFLMSGEDNSPCFLLEKLEKKAVVPFLECLAHTLKKCEGDGGVVNLDWFVGRANELSADNELKGDEDD